MTDCPLPPQSPNLPAGLLPAGHGEPHVDRLHIMDLPVEQRV